MSATVISIDRRRATDATPDPLDNAHHFLSSTSLFNRDDARYSECYPLHPHEFIGLKSHLATLRSAVLPDVGTCGLSAEELCNANRLYTLEGNTMPEGDIVLTEAEFEALKSHGAVLRNEPLK